MSEMVQSIHLESREREKLRKTSNKDFNLLNHKLEEEQRQSWAKKREVKMKEVKSTGEKLKEVQAYLSYCTGCERCATLCHIEKTFLTKYCKISK